jgi:hypothetical protein
MRPPIVIPPIIRYVWWPLMPVPPHGNPPPGPKRDSLIGLAIDEIATYITDRGTREKVRTALLEGVQTSVERLLKSVAEVRTTPTDVGMRVVAPRAMQSGKSEISARRFQVLR